MLGKYTFRKLAFIGTYVPRRCGIATFTADLVEAIAAEAPELDCLVAAINDIPEGYPYPERVRFEVAQNNQDYYRQLAEYLNMTRVDLTCLQHEYGIFGGPAGSYILTALRRLRMPIVTTLHTVLTEPDEHQRQVLEEICRLSERLVVMSERAIRFLEEIYGVPAEKIDLIHHGIPDMPFVDPNYYKDLFGVEGRRVILTFGLLSPNKGIEYMIDALPAIVQRFPDVVYIVLGITHPNVRREQGEEYRLSLQRRARELGVDSHVIFHNRYVTLEELCRFLGAADIYVTPYLNPQQIVSGTLAYSLGVGKAVVSTPYWYAEELLAEERGRLVPFRDSGALANTIIQLFEQESERHAMRKRAYAFGRRMVWKEVARAYLDTFQRASSERRRGPAVLYPPAASSDPLDIDLPDLNLNHLLTLTDDTGILQHARRTVPNLNEGYTTDDNARALLVALRARELESDKLLLSRLIRRYLAFVDFAFNRQNGRFRNFLSYDRHWLEEYGSEDSHGRALWALGYAVNLAPEEGILALAMNLFAAGLPAVELFTSPRAWAYTILGICAYARRFPGDSNARRFRELLAERLFQLYQANASADWRWFEPVLSYANARLSEALIAAGRELGRQELIDAGLKSLEWLIQVQTSEHNHFIPIAHTGWRRGGTRARFDQQPIEAHCMIEACYQAYLVTHERRWREEMRRAFEWFLGRNDLGLPVYDYTTGGCHDGLHPDGVNGNEGAEATLSFIASLLTIRSAQSPTDNR
ncbi:MAG: glycosyltransferase family 4 protein [candidate division WOR-3 bacterium]|uniref:Glycosyltransferase n=1 Tax=candidate division WOR-3 bacterium TaxID=2052148 RepID=A0A7C3J263_UNCW3|nr:glycosyltransferase family 4 protein [candidate division WOR-3 bacterium]